MDKRRSTWITNHTNINNYLRSYGEEFNRLPTKTQIATATGLSRTTIYEHLKSIETLQLNDEEKQKLKFISLSIVQRLALNGDYKSIELFLSYTDKLT